MAVIKDLTPALGKERAEQLHKQARMHVSEGHTSTPFYSAEVLALAELNMRIHNASDTSTSNLVLHAQRELDISLAEMGKEAPITDTRWNQEIADAVNDLIEVFASQGHSGGSAATVISLFNTLANYGNIEPLTDNPEEWQEVEGGMSQNTRNSACFSEDGGVTWYNINQPRKSVKWLPWSIRKRLPRKVKYKSGKSMPSPETNYRRTPTKAIEVV